MSVKQYIHYTDITREQLDAITVGNLIKINNWKKPMRVNAVSENFFVMTQKNFGNTYYSVCSKLPWDGIIHNSMRGGMFHCGPDDCIFGSPLCAEYENLYEFENEESNEAYLQEFEEGRVHISERSGIAIYDLYVKAN